MKEEKQSEQADKRPFKKAIVKETGETVMVRMCREPLQVRMAFYETEEGRKFPYHVLEYEKEIDWEQRKYELAKCAMNGILSNEDEASFACSGAKYDEKEKHTVPKAIAQYAVACADELIELLKKKQ